MHWDLLLMDSVISQSLCIIGVRASIITLALI